jgi:hypothetical protein
LNTASIVHLPKHFHSQPRHTCIRFCWCSIYSILYQRYLSYTFTFLVDNTSIATINKDMRELVRTYYTDSHASDMTVNID